MNRNYAIDYIKFFAIVCIVYIHTDPFNGAYIFGIDGAVIDNFLISVLARFGVPFFFMSSGYLLAQKMISSNKPQDYFRKYLFKTLKLFLSWFLFFAVFGFILFLGRAIMDGESVVSVAIKYLQSFLSFNVILYGRGGYASNHLWYLVALIWSIMIIYLFYKWNKIEVLLIIALILNVIGLFGQTYIGVFSLDIQTRDALFFGLFYTTLGFFFAQYQSLVLTKTKNISSKALLILFFVFSILQIGERVFAEMTWPGLIESDNYYLFTILAAMCLFLFAMKNSQLGKNSRLSKIGANAVGIYVTHTLFISITLLSCEILGIEITKSVMFHLVFAPIVIIVSYYYYMFIQKIKSRFVSFEVTQ